jgi:hypothetical protein
MYKMNKYFLWYLGFVVYYPYLTRGNEAMLYNYEAVLKTLVLQIIR